MCQTKRESVRRRSCTGNIPVAGLVAAAERALSFFGLHFPVPSFHFMVALIWEGACPRRTVRLAHPALFRLALDTRAPAVCVSLRYRLRRHPRLERRAERRKIRGVTWTALLYK